MATLRNRNGKWQAQVRIKGHAPRARSFTSKKDAQKWARQVEGELEASALRVDLSSLDRTTVRDVLERYRREVTVSKRGEASENKRLDGFTRQAWVEKPLSKVTAHVFARYRDQRLRLVSPGTVIRDLGLLRTIFEVAMTEWDLPLGENPLAKVRKPKTPQARERRLAAGELEALLGACDGVRNDWLRPIISLAVETGMRRGEILDVCWGDLCEETATLRIPVTKTGQPRRIPLTEGAANVFQSIRPARPDMRAKVFSVSPNAVRQCWERLKRKVAAELPVITDLRFHDLRHEAVSRFFEMGLSVPEVALISGHRDPRMLFRYTHLRAEDVGAKLRSAA
ncbi:MAG: tyrosine-type recombinase/integrase [Vannielia sp.]|uniref:tyrosine-type recombinase/integrase n=1 Tax=Vannielia sp. TaxID=2813045 RepID=UPI003B8E5F75